MLKSLSRLLGIAQKRPEPPEFEPIYGLPRRSLDAWLARNPKLKQEYEAKLKSRDLASNL